MLVRRSVLFGVMPRGILLLGTKTLLLLDVVGVHGCLRVIRLLHLVIWRFSQLTTAFKTLLLRFPV